MKLPDPRRRSHSHKTMRARSAASLAVALAAVVVVPSGVSSTLAAWDDSEWTNATVGTSSFDCGVDTGYAVRAESAFLRGALLGQDLGTVAELEPLVLERSGDDPVVVSPANAVDLGAGDGDPGRDTYARPLVVSALGGIVGLDLTGLTVGLPGTSVGAVNQFGRVQTTGVSTAASGLVDNTGSVLVSADTPPDELPEPARLSLDGILPGIGGVTDAALEVGAVGSQSTLDFCAAALSDEWGDGSVSGVDRDYGIASLDLDVDSPLVAALSDQVDTTVTNLDTAATALTGPNGLISGVIRSSLIGGILPALSLGSFTGTVSITGLDLEGAVEPLLSTPLSDDVVTIDPSTGSISVDLAYLLGDGAGGLNELDPNTELVLNSDVVNDITARAGVLLDGWTTDVIDALRAEIQTATVVIDLATRVSLGSTALVTVDIDSTSTIGQLTGGTASLAVNAALVPGGNLTLLNGLLSPLGLSITGLISTLNGLSGTVLTAVANRVTTSLITPLTTAGTALAAVTAPVVVLLGDVVEALPSVVSLVVNVQPDQPDAPPGSTFEGPTATTSGEFSVSALRVGLLDEVAPGGGVAFVEFATSIAGSNGLPTAS
ncbi:hypothetical protein CLV49_1264 [Labedella gwakjiensis]|uniref:Choice-of-anchor G family protein n=1 Tax=Labedella gwakjiensis TaxID=390269 RepID=A0A2P8GUK8_9MICO|nr:choice-of-anchor G family protein [Labedella gwakjiensis]PSL37657.1 hypothetical protein CLV49_1264 [Labedella gwakjiensis]RUQ87748.1 hypothetical protein ELQ93_12880 [Labedella gwakjiensis]